MEVVAKTRQSLLFSLPSFPISQSHSQTLRTWTGNEATYAHTDQLTYHNLPSMGCLVRICTGPSPGSGAYQHYVLQPLVVHVGWTNEDLCVQLASSVAIVEHLIAPEVVAIFVEIFWTLTASVKGVASPISPLLAETCTRIRNIFMLLLSPPFKLCTSIPLIIMMDRPCPEASNQVTNGHTGGMVDDDMDRSPHM